MNDHANQLSKLAFELRRVRRALTDLPRELEQRERTVVDDPDLTAEARKIKLRQIREEERAKQQKLHGRMTSAATKATVLEKKIRAKRATLVDEPISNKVRDMLARGVAPNTILERAVELHDDETVAALRAEMSYYRGEDGFADTTDTVAACDRALAEIGQEGDRDSSHAIINVTEAKRAVPEIEEFAAKAVLGQITPHDRIKLGYATSRLEED